MQRSTPWTSSERLEVLREGSRAAPKESELCLSLGEACLRVNEVDEAAKAYERAIELDPRSDLRALYWEWLGLVREMEGRLEEALEAYFSWLEVDPVAVRPLDRLGTLLVILGRWTDLKLLESQYERRAELNADIGSWESQALYTFVLQEFGDGEQGPILEVAYRALQQDPDSPSMRFLLGIIYYRDGQFELARGEFERVLDLDQQQLWRETRFALDWDGTRAKIMLAKLAQKEGDGATVLTLLESLDGLDTADSQGLTEVAELLLEYRSYRRLVDLLDALPGGPSRVERLKAEGLLYRGDWAEAEEIYGAELALLGTLSGEDAEPSEAPSSLWRRFRENAPSSAGERLKLALQLTREAPERTEVWSAVASELEEQGRFEAARLAELALTRVEGDSEVDSDRTQSSVEGSGCDVLLVLWGEGPHPTALRIQAVAAPEGATEDRLFGWAAEELAPSLELARVLLQRCWPRPLPWCHLLVKPLEDEPPMSPPVAAELQSAPLAFFLALLRGAEPSEVRCSGPTFCFGALDLHGRTEALHGLEESLLWLAGRGLLWKRIVVARDGAYRLLRCPAWLWLDRSLRLVANVEEFLDGMEES